MLTYKTDNKRRYISRGKNQYGTKKYSNPFFKNTRKKNLRRIEISSRLKIIFILIILGFLALCWFLFYSKYFLIKNINVNGQGRIDIGNIQ